MASGKRARARARKASKDPLKAALASARRSVSSQTPCPLEDELLIREAQIVKMRQSVLAMNDMFAPMLAVAFDVTAVPARALAGEMRKIVTAVGRLMLHFHKVWQQKARKDLTQLPLFTKVSKSLNDLNKLRDSIQPANVYFKVPDVKAKLDHAYALFETLTEHWRRDLDEGYAKLEKEKGIPREMTVPARWAAANQLPPIPSSHQASASASSVNRQPHQSRQIPSESRIPEVTGDHTNPAERDATVQQASATAESAHGEPNAPQDNSEDNQPVEGEPLNDHATADNAASAPPESAAQDDDIAQTLAAIDLETVAG